MKAQRVFRIATGMLCLIAALGMTGFSVYLLYAALFPEMSTFSTGLFEGLKQGFALVAGYWGMNASYALALLFYLIPTLLLVAGGVTLLLARGKAATIAGCVLALTGIAPITGFSAICSKELVGSNAVALFCTCLALLAVFVAAVGCTLGLKKRPEQFEQPQDETQERDEEQCEAQAEQYEPQIVPQYEPQAEPHYEHDEQADLSSSDWTNFAETSEQPIVEPQPMETLQAEPAETQTEFDGEVNAKNAVEQGEAQTATEPFEARPQRRETQTYDSVESAMDSVYGRVDEPKKVNPKLTMLRTLLDSGAISQSEYEELIRMYK